jgi:hypothetical protein
VKNAGAQSATAWIVLAALTVAAPSRARAEGASAGAALESLLARAAETGPGTYVVRAGSLASAAQPLPVLLQADAYRGAARTIRVAVAVGAEVPRGTAARLRISGAGGTAAAPPRIFSDVTATMEGGRLVREFTLGAGDYELHAVVAHPRAGDDVAALARTRLTVPDVWKGALAVTPVVLGESPSAAVRTRETSAFVFGPTALMPAARNVYAQDGNLHLAFRVFNWKAEAGRRPDLTAEYTFYQQTARRLSFFNKIKPQSLDAGALGAAFDPASGAVSAGMSVPLVSFPFGEFEVKVRITDNATRQSAERRARFVVSPSVDSGSPAGPLETRQQR